MNYVNHIHEMFSRLPENYRRITRFLISGGSATAVTIGSLYFFNTVLGFWYVSASVLAFLVGFAVSFTMQKFWTFQNAGLEGVHQQVVLYFLIVACNLFLNTALVYFFVEYFLLKPVLAQLFASALIACESYFAYRVLVFSQGATDESVQ